MNGTIGVYDQINQQLAILTSDGKRAKVSVPHACRELARSAVQAGLSAIVRVEGQASSEGKNVSFSEIRRLDVTRFPGPSIEQFEKRVAQLEGLESGWLEPGGEPVDSHLLRRVADALRAGDEAFLVPLPHIGALETGALELEWIFGEWSVDCEIEGASRKLLFEAYHPQSDEELSFTGTIWSDAERKRLAQFLRSVMARSAQIERRRGSDDTTDRRPNPLPLGPSSQASWVAVSQTRN